MNAGILATLTTAYAFSAGSVADYDVSVVFDGFLPVLGGNEGKAEIAMRVRVTGSGPVDPGVGAVSEITAFDMAFNGAKLPLTLENVTDYFPRTTIVLTAQGKIVQNDAPDRRLPVRLPGLDVRRFPDITYVPIEFARAETAVGDDWTFERDFGGVPMRYSCHAASETEGLLRVDVRVEQEYAVLENDSLEVVQERSRAAREVRTKLVGEGFVLFDTGAGTVREADMRNVATSVATPLAGGEATQRRLVTEYKVKRSGARAASRPAAPPLWKQAADLAAAVARDPRRLAGMLQLAAAAGLQRLPEQWTRWLAPVADAIRPWFPAASARR
jgi:hypothetical protein